MLYEIHNWLGWILLKPSRYQHTGPETGGLTDLTRNQVSGPVTGQLSGVSRTEGDLDRKAFFALNSRSTELKFFTPILAVIEPRAWQWPALLPQAGAECSLWTNERPAWLGVNQLEARMGYTLEH